MRATLLFFAVTTLALAVYAGRVQFRGINAAGLEFDTSVKSSLNTFWQTQKPWLATVDYWNARKANLIRIPFRWDVLQNPTNTGSWSGPPNAASWNTDYLAYIVSMTNKATNLGITVVLDCHQYARYPYSGATDGNLIFSNSETNLGHFKAFWQKLAATSSFINNPKVWFQLMNEPSPNSSGYGTYTAQNTYDLMLAGLQGIRAAGANNKVLVSGTVWSGAHDFVNFGHNGDFYTVNVGAPSNADVFQQGFPGLGDWAIDVHTYFDDNHAGTSTACHPITTDPYASLSTYWSAKNNLDALTAWAKQYNFQLFLGEVGWGQDLTNCQQDAYDLLTYLDTNSLVSGSTPSQSGPWLGWAYWAASTHFSSPDASYNFNVEPDYYGCGGNDGSNPDNQGLATCQTSNKWSFTNVFKPYCYFYDPVNPAQGPCPAIWGSSGTTSGTTTTTTGTPTSGSSTTTTSGGAGATCTSPAVPADQQCGNSAGYPRIASAGPASTYSCCPSGQTCQYVNDYWWQCKPAPTSTTTSGSTTGGSTTGSSTTGSSTTSGSTTSGTSTTSGGTCVAAWSQCGGTNPGTNDPWTGPTTCCAGAGPCTVINFGYSQCKPSRKRFNWSKSVF